MRAERFRQIRNLFDAAMEREPGARNAFLQQACRGDEELLIEVGKLLAAQGQPTEWIDESMLGKSASSRLEGRRIGAYEILRRLGEGGMGSVYLAAPAGDGEKRDLVALKIVRSEAATDEVLRRFKRERQILESLQHPNIARILDAGVTDDGLPYLVMEYVDGQSIDKYCDERHLDFAARLKLFRHVCAAVHFAHEHRIVHRDLKPSNIFVTEDGVVKLLDFGISKLAAEGPDGPTCLTRTDLLLMTPEYASPEQVSGLTATPASDVYALGVVLYELLTGRRPYRLKSRILREIARVICEEPPMRPSTAVTDIDRILMKTLEKSPARRYRSAQQLAEEIGRHLQGKPVDASRHAVAKAFGRYVGMNWWWLVIVGGVAAALFSGAVVIENVLLFLVVAIAAVVIAGYTFDKWRRGDRSARRVVRAVISELPVIAAGMIAMVFLGRYSVARVIFLSLMFLCAVYYSVLIRVWFKNDHPLGPLVVELRARYRKSRWLLTVFPLLFAFILYRQLFVLRVSYELPLLIVLFAMSVPLSVLLSVVRIQFRQRGLVNSMGVPCPWTDLASYSWESGGGKIEGRYDILFMRFKGGFPMNLEIPVADRPAINALLEQQAFEWPS